MALTTAGPERSFSDRRTPRAGALIAYGQFVNDLVLRFALGGAAVSVFSALAELFKPKTFSGILGAAPAVALVSLALTFEQRGHAVVRDHALGMICGGTAFLAYAGACVVATAYTRMPVWLGAAICWAVWFLVAAAAWVTVRPS